MRHRIVWGDVFDFKPRSIFKKKKKRCIWSSSYTQTFKIYKERLKMTFKKEAHGPYHFPEHDRNELNVYPSFTSITWVGEIYAKR